MAQSESESVVPFLTILLTTLDKIQIVWHQNLKCSISIILEKKPCILAANMQRPAN